MKITIEIVGRNLNDAEVAELRESLVQEGELILNSRLNGRLPDVSSVHVKLEPGPFTGFARRISRVQP